MIEPATAAQMILRLCLSRLHTFHELVERIGCSHSQVDKDIRYLKRTGQLVDDGMRVPRYRTVLV